MRGLIRTRISAARLRMILPHLPALRRGQPYESLEKNDVVDHRTGEVRAQVSQVNAGIIRKDLARIHEARRALKQFRVADLIDLERPKEL